MVRNWLEKCQKKEKRVEKNMFPNLKNGEKRNLPDLGTEPGPPG